jgi:hypothetical protein
MERITRVAYVTACCIQVAIEYTIYHGREICDVHIILWHVLVTIDGVWIGYIDHLQVVTTNNCYTIADFHIPNYSTLSLLSLFPVVVTW